VEIEEVLEREACWLLSCKLIAVWCLMFSSIFGLGMISSVLFGVRRLFQDDNGRCSVN
jgi:hypothetical protein